LVTRKLDKAAISIVESHLLDPDGGISDSMPEHDSYIVTHMLSAFPACEVWASGRHAVTADIGAGTTTLTDLRCDPRFVMNRPFHALHFQIPTPALAAIAEEAAAPPVSDLRYEAGFGYRDEITGHLASSILAALRQPEEANQLFVDYVVMALTAHVAQTYGGMRFIKDLPKGGLAPWQERRACELLAAHFDGDLPLKELAAQCGLSPSHFSRAFRQSTGLPPHRWLLRYRIEAAKALMEGRGLSLTEIALSTGFNDQSHFSRVFVKHVGVSPGAWRRTRNNGSGTIQ
jgi:AraC-like DNA-binding protein